MIPKYFLSVWSFPPSHKSVNGEEQQDLMNSSFNAGASAYFTIAVVFILPYAKP